MKSRQSQIEPWNVRAHTDALAFDEPQVWVLLTILEVKALKERIVPTRVVQICSGLDREVLVRPDAEALPASVKTDRGGLLMEPERTR